MIRDTLNRKQAPAITSDRWHIVRGCWTGDPSTSAKFARSIVSEHENSAAALRAVRELRSSVRAEMAVRPRAARDQFFVRAPDFKSLKTAGRVRRRPH